jgi:hypothetical protein
LINNCHIYPRTIPPIRFGIKNTVRKTFVPLIFRVRRRASKNAKTLIRIIETTANFAVNIAAFKKFLSSEKARR